MDRERAGGGKVPFFCCGAPFPCLSQSPSDMFINDTGCYGAGTVPLCERALCVRATALAEK